MDKGEFSEQGREILPMLPFRNGRAFIENGFQSYFLKLTDRDKFRMVSDYPLRN